MCKEKELSFSIYMLYSLADKWQKSPADVYKILNATGFLSYNLSRTGNQVLAFREAYEVK